MWGTATASYQVEGAWNVSGRGLSIWDTFTQLPSGKVAGNETGNIADDSYHRFPEDIKLMSQMGVKYARFSISWSRIFPSGRGALNPAAIIHYNRVIDMLLANNIQPLVTLYHWDLPQGLQDLYNGWISSDIIQDFSLYADACFAAFGDRVKHWLTFNEPLTFCPLGYGSGSHAPGRCSDRSYCAEGNSTTEPWLCGHHVLLSHAAAVQIYRYKYQKQQRGLIGITLNTDWAEPYTSAPADVAAAIRQLDFTMGWFADPVHFGDYPASMRQALGELLPQFDESSKKLLKGSSDFYGLNHYTSSYCANDPNPGPGNWAAVKCGRVSSDGTPIGPRADSDWLYVVPWGIQKVILYITERYNPPSIIVTENGVDVPKESSIPLPAVLNDSFRVNFLTNYLDNVRIAIEKGAPVHGYFVWSMLDNFEWADGYSKRFGIHYVDYNNGLKRYPKASAAWYSNFVKQNS